MLSNLMMPLLLSIILFMGGCALQSSLVSLEQDVLQEEEQVQQIQSSLNTLRAQVEKQAKEMRAEKPQQAPNQKGVSALVLEIDRLKDQFRRLEGRIEEEGRKASQAMKATDDQAHQVDTLSSRVSSIEKRLPVETSEATSTVPVAGYPAPTEAYTLAYNDYLRGNYDLSILSFQNFLSQYPNATQAPQALYWTGQSYYNKAAYTDAISFFEQIENRFPQHDTAPNALLKTGLSLIKLGKTDKAKATLQKVIEKFPESSEAHLAKDKLADLR